MDLIEAKRQAELSARLLPLERERQELEHAHNEAVMRHGDAFVLTGGDFLSAINLYEQAMYQAIFLIGNYSHGPVFDGASVNYRMTAVSVGKGMLAQPQVVISDPSSIHRLGKLTAGGLELPEALTMTALPIHFGIMYRTADLHGVFCEQLVPEDNSAARIANSWMHMAQQPLVHLGEHDSTIQGLSDMILDTYSSEAMSRVLSLMAGNALSFMESLKKLRDIRERRLRGPARELFRAASGQIFS